MVRHVAVWMNNVFVVWYGECGAVLVRRLWHTQKNLC